MDIDNTELEGIDNFYSNESIEKITDAFSEPFEDENISESMFKAAPDMFDDSTFGGFNRTVVGGAVDALDLGMRTIESGVKGSATAINEAKNYVTGQDDDRLKRDILAFFETAGVGGATSGPMKVRQGINQLIKSGKKDEAAKVILAESDAFKKDNFKEVLAMTAKREPSPVRQMAEAPPLEIGLNKFNLENPDKLLRNYSIDNFTKTEKVSGRSKSGLGSKGDKKINAPVEDGKEVSVRLNLNSKIDPDGPKEPFNHMQTIHPVVKGKPNYKQADSYKTAVSLENGTFHIDQNLRRMIAEDGMKVPAMSVQGKYTKNRNIFDEMDDSVIEIGTNPRNSHLFVDLKTGQAVKGFDLATVFRDRVYAKGVTYWKKSDAPKPLSAKGDVPIDNQVRYKFKRGGLMART